jgi:hypothetical protein
MIERPHIGLHATVVCPDHTVPPVGLGDGAATCEHGELLVSVIPQKELYFLPTIWRIRCREVEVGMNSVPKSDEDVHTAQNHRFHARVLSEPGTKVVPQIEVGLNPHIGVTHGHIGHHVQDPRRGHVMQFEAIELQQRAKKFV